MQHAIVPTGQEALRRYQAIEKAILDAQQQVLRRGKQARDLEMAKAMQRHGIDLH